MNVLIVEDDLPIADLLRDALESGGHYVCEIARTADEAMEEATKHHPDCAVVDVHLADGSLGTDFAARLRQTRDTRIMFSTGSDDRSIITYHEGDAVMTKPYLMSDAVRGLQIIEEVAKFGKSARPFPPNFRLVQSTGLTSEPYLPTWGYLG